MPAAAVIPAPIAYIKVVAVKKLVVEVVNRTVGAPILVFTYMLRFVQSVGKWYGNSLLLFFFKDQL